VTRAIQSVAPILTFARLTIWEAARRRLLVALVLLTVGIVIVTSFGFSRLWTVTEGGVPIGEVQVRLIASQLLVAVTFMFSFVLALSSVMVAAPSISGDVESGLVLSLLGRPVRRFDVAIGKWLGLALAGACDSISGIFRTAIWNRSVPDALRGRLAAIEMVSYSSGPLLGDFESGTVASLLSVRASVVSGGLLCVAGCLVCALLLPAFRRYEA